MIGEAASWKKATEGLKRMLAMARARPPLSHTLAPSLCSALSLASSPLPMPCAALRWGHTSDCMLSVTASGHIWLWSPGDTQRHNPHGTNPP